MVAMSQPKKWQINITDSGNEDFFCELKKEEETMKKILVAIFAVLVTAAWVLPAMAVDTTFYGAYRVRAFSTNNNLDYAGGDKIKTYTGVGSTTLESANATDENSWID